MSRPDAVGLVPNVGFIDMGADGRPAYIPSRYRGDPAQEREPYRWTDTTCRIEDVSEPQFAAVCSRCGWVGPEWSDPDSPEQDALWHRCGQPDADPGCTHNWPMTITPGDECLLGCGATRG